MLLQVAALAPGGEAITLLDQGGPTSATNLTAECRRHHRGKTLNILTVTGNPNTTLTWTDQHSHTSKTQPHNYNNGL